VAPRVAATTSAVRRARVAVALTPEEPGGGRGVARPLARRPVRRPRAPRTARASRMRPIPSRRHRAETRRRADLPHGEWRVALVAASRGYRKDGSSPSRMGLLSRSRSSRARPGPVAAGCDLRTDWPPRSSQCHRWTDSTGHAPRAHRPYRMIRRLPLAPGQRRRHARGGSGGSRTAHR